MLHSDFPRGYKRSTDPAELVAQLAAEFPNDVGKQKRVFEALVCGRNGLLSAVIQKAFDALTEVRSAT